MAKKTRLVKGKEVKQTVICVWEVNDGCSSPPKVFIGYDEKKVVKAAEDHFAALLKEYDPLMHKDDDDKSEEEKEKEFQELLRECLDSGDYDNENGYEIVLSWPVVNMVE